MFGKRAFSVGPQWLRPSPSTRQNANPGCIPRSHCRRIEPVDFAVAHAILQSQQVFRQAFDCIRFLSDFALPGSVQSPCATAPA
jgi:hypothetical protein